LEEANQVGLRLLVFGRWLMASVVNEPQRLQRPSNSPDLQR
jgi:hypothetical protein